MKIFKNIVATLTFVFVAFLGLVSCEEDFENIESGVLTNSLVSSGEVHFDIKITPNDSLGGVRADNIAIGNLIDKYWLGNYTQNTLSKTIQAGFVSQLELPTTTRLVTSLSDNQENIKFFLDKVVLKIPYSATSTGASQSNGETLFRLDSILPSDAFVAPTEIKVYRNPFFLNILNPNEPQEQNLFKSNFDFFLANTERELLSEENFSYIPSADAVTYFFERPDRSEGFVSTTNFRDSIVLSPRINETLQAATAPFLAIPLNLDKMKELFWDRFNDAPEFKSFSAFQDYFKGIIVLSEDEDGILVPFNLNNSRAQLSFIFSRVNVTNPDAIDVRYGEYNFPLNGIRSAIYNMTDAQQETSSDTFIVQGTDGSNATIEILGVNIPELPQNHPFLKYADKDLNNDGYLDLEELSKLKDVNGNNLIIINNAELQFSVNNNISSGLSDTPEQLHLYQNKNANGQEIDTNIPDAFEASFQSRINNMRFGGNLNFEDEGIRPANYKFKLTGFISDFMTGANTEFDTRLVLKVFNESTDAPIVNINNTPTLRINVEEYNWNPRSVVLFNETAENSQKAHINVVFSELSN